jgi:biopolymer transport protein ExbD
MAVVGPKHDDEIIADINVTPLVDIVLVLLIIFMVTASVIVTPAIKVDLPKAANADDNPESTLSLILSDKGDLYLNGEQIPWDAIPDRNNQLKAEQQDLQAVISAEHRISHGKVIHLIDTIKGLGISKFALTIEQVDYETTEEG